MTSELNKNVKKKSFNSKIIVKKKIQKAAAQQYSKISELRAWPIKK